MEEVECMGKNRHRGRPRLGWMDGERKALRGMGKRLEQARQNSLNRRECTAIVKRGVALGPSLH